VARPLTAATEQDSELGLFLRLAVVLGPRRGELIGLNGAGLSRLAGTLMLGAYGLALALVGTRLVVRRDIT
jgi:hypothetical protein